MTNGGQAGARARGQTHRTPRKLQPGCPRARGPVSYRSPRCVSALVFVLYLFLKFGGLREPSLRKTEGPPAGVTPAAIAKGDTIYHKTGLCVAVPRHPTPRGRSWDPGTLRTAELIDGFSSYD